MWRRKISVSSFVITIKKKCSANEISRINCWHISAPNFQQLKNAHLLPGNVKQADNPEENAQKQSLPKLWLWACRRSVGSTRRWWNNKLTAFKQVMKNTISVLVQEKRKILYLFNIFTVTVHLSVMDFSAFVWFLCSLLRRFHLNHQFVFLLPYCHIKPCVGSIREAEIL